MGTKITVRAEVVLDVEGNLEGVEGFMVAIDKDELTGSVSLRVRPSVEGRRFKIESWNADVLSEKQVRTRMIPTYHTPREIHFDPFTWPPVPVRGVSPLHAPRNPKPSGGGSGKR